MPPYRAFAKGDRVEVLPRVGRALSKGKKSESNGTLKWKNRKGTVKYCNRYNVYVIWDGRKTAETMPVGAFKRIEES